MSFFKRQPSKQNSVTMNERRKSSALEDPEWKQILHIKSEVIKAWRLQPQGPAIQVPDEELGFFLSEEKYVVLKTSNNAKKLVYDLHFWLGKGAKPYTEPPEKVAEIMALLNNNVVIHREVGENESPQFKAYFKEFGVLDGNVSSLFNPEDPGKYQPRLLHFCLTRSKTRVEVTQVPISRQSLKSNDVYIFDEGVKMTQWNGSRCDDEERISAKKYIERALKQRKTKCTSEFFDEEDLLEKNEFYEKLGNEPVPLPSVKLSKKTFQKKLLRLSDESKKLVLTPVFDGKVYRNGINPDDVTFVDTLNVLFIFTGPGANENEKSSVWSQADIYLKDAGAPNKSIAVFAAGCYCEGFEEVWDDLRQ